MKMTYDKKADAAYIHFNDKINDEKVTRTINITDNLIVDLGKSDKIFGLEILNATLSLGKNTLRDLKKEKINIPIISIA